MQPQKWLAILLLFLSSGSLLAADITGLWMGQMPGRFDKLEDISFQFKTSGNTLQGKLFGDEFDLPIENATLTADTITFTVTSINYYSREKVVFKFTGICRNNEIEFTRERVILPTDKTQKKADSAPKPFIVKRLSSQSKSDRPHL